MKIKEGFYLSPCKKHKAHVEIVHANDEDYEIKIYWLNESEDVCADMKIFNPDTFFIVMSGWERLEE